MMRCSLLSSASVAVIALTANANAQTSNPVDAGAPQVAAAQSASPADDNGQIGDIIVTAQKRSENISKVPLSITAITGEQLTGTASKTLEELQGVVPGVTFPKQTAYGGSTIVIRGTSGQGVFLEDDPIAVYVDGIYQASNSRFGVSDLTDVQSVEIVRGPQGTLQGRNATAGAILVRTNDPTPDVSGFARLTVAAPWEFRAEGAVSVPVTETLGLRLSGDHYGQRGFAYDANIADYLGGQTATNLRAVLKWRPSSRFSLRLALNYQTLTNRPASARWATTNVNPTGQAVTAATPYVSLPPALQRQYLDNDLDLNIASRNVQRSPSAALEMHYDFGGVELVSITGASRATNDGQSDSDGLGKVGTNGVSLVDSVSGQLRQAYNRAHVEGDQQTEELRLQSNGSDAFKWLVGVFGSRAYDTFQFDIYNLKLTVPINEVLDFKASQTDLSGAAFADGTLKLTDQFSLTGGLRYTKESKLFANAFTVTNIDANAVIAGPIRNLPPRTSWEDLSYRGGINFQANRDLLLYVSYSKGFKSGGFNAFGVGAAPAFSPEKLYSLEVGTKAYFWDRRGYIALSGYLNRYENLQVTAGVPTGGQIVQNAAAARIKGIELQGELRPTDSLTLSGNVAYTDARYRDFLNAGAVDGGLVNASGLYLPNTPKWQYYLQADYVVPIRAGWQADLQASWRWRDTVYFFGTNEAPNLRGAPDGELGARIDVANKSSGWSLAVFARNLTDRRVVANEQVQFAYPVAFFNEPRTVGLALTKKF